MKDKRREGKERDGGEYVVRREEKVKERTEGWTEGVKIESEAQANEPSEERRYCENEGARKEGVAVAGGCEALVHDTVNSFELSALRLSFTSGHGSTNCALLLLFSLSVCAPSRLAGRIPEDKRSY